VKNFGTQMQVYDVKWSGYNRLIFHAPPDGHASVHEAHIPGPTVITFSNISKNM